MPNHEIPVDNAPYFHRCLCSGDRSIPKLLRGVNGPAADTFYSYRVAETLAFYRSMGR